MVQRICERINQGGSNANVSNVIAAVFAATGQDIASVNESSFGQISVEHNFGPGGGVNVSMLLPSLIVGTVGGGTSLPSQSNCLDMIGCRGAGKREKLAEIIATYCLALDLSTISAMVAGQFALAHDALGRNRPDNESASGLGDNKTSAVEKEVLKKEKPVSKVNKNSFPNEVSELVYWM